MAEIDGAGSYVKINKVANGWTWNVQVVASSNTLDDMHAAKEQALQLDAELREKLLPVPYVPEY